MARKVFVDTGGWIGFLCVQDDLHEKSVEAFARVVRSGDGFLTTSAVLLEVVDGLAQHRLRFLAPALRH